MMAGSNTLGTYDTFNYQGRASGKRPQPIIRRMACGEIDKMNDNIVGYGQYHLR